MAFEVKDLIGIPYKKHGRDESGLDCFGLIIIIAARRGTPIPDVWYDKHDPALMSLAEKMGFHHIPACAPDCVIEMEYARRLHLGYALDNQTMIHATFDGVCLDNIGKYKIRGFYGFNQRGTRV
jgi:hypothetical protein